MLMQRGVPSVEDQGRPKPKPGHASAIHLCSACSKRTFEYLLAHHEEDMLGMLVKA